MSDLKIRRLCLCNREDFVDVEVCHRGPRVSRHMRGAARLRMALTSPHRFLKAAACRSGITHDPKDAEKVDFPGQVLRIFQDMEIENEYCRQSA